MPVGNATNWTALGAGGSHSGALRTNGSRPTWGWNEYGQLGDGTVTSRSTPG
ncbi:RCC1 domain-containing protein [Hymenobacter ginkgonis]|uniref:RCC1 domain-containing protein n=1 Tax=Hymenobacter ginkgonis TaxID=2682976 RepID=UPI0018DEBC42|nr:RCC1 domain-containing protein [Hymenobacter ginkgonis]